jgi:hypothetical protein
VALLAEFTVPAALHAMSLVALGGMLTFLAASLALMSGRVRPIAWSLRVAQRWNVTPASLLSRTEKLLILEERVSMFARRHPVRLAWALVLELAYHAAGVLETWITLAMLLPAGTAPTLLGSFLLESLNRFVNVAFKFVPMRLGVDEAGTGLLTQVLYGTPVLGVTLAVVRKARMLVWTGVGVAYLATRGLTSRDALRARGSS